MAAEVNKMNREQKAAWLCVITTSIGVVCSFIAITVLYIKYGFPKASVGLGFLGISGLAGLSPLLFKKDPGPVKIDERDRQIKERSKLMGFTAAYLLVGLSCMVPFFIYGPDVTISLFWLPMIFITAGIANFFFYSVAILLQYGRGGKKNE
jgi:hypothetical protein